MSALPSFRSLPGKLIVYLTSISFSLIAGNFAFSQPLDPLSFTSLGTLNLTSGDYTIDTDTLTIVDNTAPGVALFTGVVDDQNGTAMPGVVPEIAVFAFNDIDLDPTANVAITGSRALALLSRGDAIISTPLSLDAPFNNWDGLPSVAGPGGFAGGTPDIEPGETTDLRDSRLFVPGLGPGGGNSAVPGPGALIIQGSASFGGAEHIVSGEILPSTTYGNLLQTLQGGSGGASSSIKDFQVTGNLDVLPATGVGGGGAIEIGAVGSVQIDADITARGGAQLLLSNPVDGLLYDSSGSVGSGSGGGIRIHGAQVDVNAILSADFSITPGTGNERGGGGRVLVLNRTSDLPLFVLGREDVASTSYFDNLSAAGAGTQGIFTVSPIQSVVPMGEVMRIQAPSLELTIDLPFVAGSSLLRPTPVEIVLTNARILSGGTVDVGTGAVNRYLLELDGPDATVLGTGTLINKGVLSGTGRVEVPTINLDTGEINTTNDMLTFTQPVTNAAGGLVNSISSMLTFPGDGLPTSSGGDNADGLTNHGNLNLINTTIEGDVHSPAGSTITVGGGVVFNGLVSGGGNFPGAGGVTFNGGYAPGDSPAQVSLGGDLTLSDTNTLYIELGGTTAGVEYDRVEVDGFAMLEGTLDVSLINGFTPALGNNFGFLMASGGFDTSFSSLNLPDLSAQGLDWQLNPSGATLFLEVVAALDGDFDGDGDIDGADFLTWQRNPSVGNLADWQAGYGSATGSSSASSTAVPEPSSMLLAAFASFCAMSVQRRS